MWFVGLLIGLVLGSIFEGDDRAFVSAALGAALGTIVSLLKQSSIAPELEARVCALESAVQGLRHQLAGRPAARADVAEKAPEPTDVQSVAIDDAPATPEPVRPQAVAAHAAQSPAPESVATPTGGAWTPQVPDVLYKFWQWLSGGIGEGAIQLRAGWVGREIVFAARAPEPSMLAYGNGKAQANALAIKTAGARLGKRIGAANIQWPRPAPCKRWSAKLPRDSVST